jgi:hypothetical protein
MICVTIEVAHAGICQHCGRRRRTLAHLAGLHSAVEGASHRVRTHADRSAPVLEEELATIPVRKGRSYDVSRTIDACDSGLPDVDACSIVDMVRVFLPRRVRIVTRCTSA